jgi:hypothetical protein
MLPVFRTAKSLSVLAMVFTLGTGNCADPLEGLWGSGIGNPRPYQQEPADSSSRGEKKEEDEATKNLVKTGLTTELIQRMVGKNSGLLRVRAEALPAGLERQLVRGKPLPPTAVKRPVYPGLLGRLPQYDGYQWCSIGKDLLLITNDGIVAEVMPALFQ